MYRAENHRVAMLTLRVSAMFHGGFPPGTFRYPLWIPGGQCADMVKSGTSPMGPGGTKVYEYLLIIHVRKKSAAWRKVPPRFLCPGVPPAGFEGDWVGLRRSWDSSVIGWVSGGLGIRG
jgi:hypothetical protein